MVQLVALQARGTRYDPARVMADAERIRAGRIANESNEISLGEQRDEATALSQYRGAAQAGDPNAISALDGYPAHQRKILEALDGMSAEDVQGALNRAREVNEAANYVASFPQGTPEREAAWAEQIGELEQKGYVTPDQAKAWIEQGPSDLMLQDAIGTTDFVLGQYGGGKAALNNAKVETEQARRAKLVAEAENTTGVKRDKILAEIRKIDAGTGTELKRQDKIGADTELSRAKTRGEEADVDLTEEKGGTEKAKQGKYGADTELSRARTENVESDTVNDTELSKAKVGKYGADTELSKARTDNVRNKTGLETAESGAEVEETKAKTGKVKAGTRQIEADIENERDLAKARIEEYQAGAAKKRADTGAGGDVKVRDRLDVDEAIRTREKELGLDFPLPDDATPEEIKEREAAEAKFEAYKDEWLAIVGKVPSGKQGPATLNPDASTTPGKAAAAPSSKMAGSGTEKDPYTGFTRDEFNKLAPGSVYINPKDGRLLRKRAPDAAGR